MIYKISPELLPVLSQLQDEGFEVYAYTDDRYSGEINSLFWYENGRVLDVQPNQWRSRSNRDHFDIGVEYVPSSANGSGSRLSNDDTGVRAEDLLKYRKRSTWNFGYRNFKSMADFIKAHRPLTYRKFNRAGELEAE